jgi:hypothetical protein
MTKESEILGILPPHFLRLQTYLNESQDAFKKDKIKIKKVFIDLAPDIIFLPKKCLNV